MKLKTARKMAGKDIYSKRKRSNIMSRIRSKNTKIELLIFGELGKRRIHFQKHYTKVCGKPDIALPRKKRAVFIDSDFWHGHNYAAMKPKLKKKFWRDKIEYNIRHDKEVMRKLKVAGWKALRIREGQIKRNLEKTVNNIEIFLTKYPCNN